MFHSTRVSSSRDAASAPSWGRTAAYCLRAAIERAVPAHALETIIQPRATQLRRDGARLVAVFAEIALAGPPHGVAGARHLVELAMEILTRQRHRLDHDRRQRNCASRPDRPFPDD